MIFRGRLSVVWIIPKSIFLAVECICDNDNVINIAVVIFATMIGLFIILKESRSWMSKGYKMICLDDLEKAVTSLSSKKCQREKQRKLSRVFHRHRRRKVGMSPVVSTRGQHSFNCSYGFLHSGFVGRHLQRTMHIYYAEATDPWSKLSLAASSTH